MFDPSAKVNKIAELFIEIIVLLTIKYNNAFFIYGQAVLIIIQLNYFKLLSHNSLKDEYHVCKVKRK